MTRPATGIDWRSATPGAPPSDAPAWISEVNNPYMQGVYAPVRTELSAVPCEVIGQLPADLEGIYVRNGPNNAHKPCNRYHWFDGDGMLFGLLFRDGKAAYTNRWIQTDGFLAERAAGRAIWPGMMGPFDFSRPDGPIKDTANTQVIFHHGRLLALWYNAGDAYAFDPVTFANLGKDDFQGTLKHRLSAHAHVDEFTGELLFFNFSDTRPYLSFGVANTAGRLTHHVEVEIPGVRLPHDLGFTERYVVLHDLPFFHDLDLLRKTNKRVVSFHRNIPARFGVIPRRGAADQIRWFEAESCYILHVIASWEEGDWIIMDGCRSINPMPKADPEEGSLSSLLAYLRLEANLHRWRFNLKTGETREEDLDDLNTEFPMTNAMLAGRQIRYAYTQYIPPDRTLTFRGLVKYDTQTGTRQRYNYGATVHGSEAPFAPRKGWNTGDAEDDGYVVSFTTDTADWSSQCLVFDARDIAAGPVCRVKLPHRLPAGFHTAWIPGERVFTD